jgi:hypothetical protein
VLPTGASAEVGGEPTATTDASAGAVAAVGLDRWSRDGTPSGTSEMHYWMEHPRSFSSWFSCERGWHRL